jgi:hypothetical protein
MIRYSRFLAIARNDNSRTPSYHLEVVIETAARNHDPLPAVRNDLLGVGQVVAQGLQFLDSFPSGSSVTYPRALRLQYGGCDDAPF